MGAAPKPGQYCVRTDILRRTLSALGWTRYAGTAPATCVRAAMAGERLNNARCQRSRAPGFAFEGFSRVTR